MALSRATTTVTKQHVTAALSLAKASSQFDLHSCDKASLRCAKPTVQLVAVPLRAATAAVELRPGIDSFSLLRRPSMGCTRMHIFGFFLMWFRRFGMPPK